MPGVRRKQMDMAEFSPLRSLFALAPELPKASGHTLSVYCGARSDGYDVRFYDIVFRELLNRYRDRLGDGEKQVLERELPRLRAHLAILKPAGCPALAGFADEASGVLRVIPLRAETEARLEVGEPLFAPILRQLEEFPPALVVVVDKEEARIFAAILDDVVPIDHLSGVVVRHIRSGGTSAPSNQRKADNRARGNLEHAAKRVEREMASGVYHDLYIGGPMEARTEFEQLLPERLRQVVAGHIPAEMDSPTLQHELRQKLIGARPART
jgi:hypothetical protein